MGDVDNPESNYLPADIAGQVIGASSQPIPYSQALFLSRFDASGNLVWVKPFAMRLQPPNPAVRSLISSLMASDPAGNLYLAGWFTSFNSQVWPAIIDFGGISLTNTYAEAFTGTFFAAKFNSAGEVVWVKRIAPNFDELGLTTYASLPETFFSDFKADGEGNLYVTGEMGDKTDLTNPYAVRQFLMKIDTSGKGIWAASAPADEPGHGLGYLAVDATGSCFVTGVYYGGACGYITKYDPYGKMLWSKNLGNPSAIATGPGGRLYAVASYSPYADNPGTFFPFHPYPSNGDGVGLMALESDGTARWSLFQPTDTVGGYFRTAQLAAGPDNELYYGGTFVSSALFGGLWLRTPESSYDARDFLAKLAYPKTNALPVITLQPEGASLVAGDSIHLEVLGFSDSPLTYQWIFNDSPIGGATNRTLVVTYLRAAAGGSYSVRVNNAVGTTPSSPAIVTVLPASRLGAALGATNVNWSVGGDRGWRIETDFTHGSPEAAVCGIARLKILKDLNDRSSGEIDNTSWLDAAVEGPGALSFWWKVSSMSGEDYLSLWLDHTNLVQISGNLDWTQRSVAVTGGPHVIYWEYTHGQGEAFIGYDSGWLADVAYAPADQGGAPRIASAEFLKDGGFQIDISGPPAALFGIEASSDLQTWLPIGQVSSGTGVTNYIHSAASNVSKHFYRVRMVQ